MKEHNERRERAKDVIQQYRLSTKFK